MTEPNEKDADVDALWSAEIHRRMEEIRTGQVTCIPAEIVFAEARERVQALRTNLRLRRQR